MSAAEAELLRDISKRIASITDPKKPTKPLAEACVGCGGTGVDLNQHCCFECGGKGYL